MGQRGAPMLGQSSTPVHRLTVGRNWRLFDNAERPSKRLRVQRELVVVTSGINCEVHAPGRAIMVGPHGADLLPEDTVTGAFVGLLERLVSVGLIR